MPTDEQLSVSMRSIKRSLKHNMPEINGRYFNIQCHEHNPGYRFEINFVLTCKHISIYVGQFELSTGMTNFNIIYRLAEEAKRHHDKSGRPLTAIKYLHRLAGYKYILDEKTRVAKLNKKVAKMDKHINAKLDAILEILQYSPGNGTEYLKAEKNFNALKEKQ